MTAAVAAQPVAASDLVQVLPPIATVVAAVVGALITGFWAAAVKHRWDVAADDKRWRQDGEARNRAQRLDAFAHYLSVRPDLRTIRALTSRTMHQADAVSGVRLAAANLLILLPDEGQRTVVEHDLRAVEDWLDLWLRDPSAAARSDVPSPGSILQLARELVTESPGQASAGPPGRASGQLGRQPRGE